MIYRFRVILDDKDDVFRDIEIKATATAEDFHNSIVQAFGFDGGEMASFYISDDEWSQGEEVALFDMSEGGAPLRIMNETPLDDIITEHKRKLIYVYDFMNMWTFLVELAEIVDEAEGTDYPNLMFVHGQIPEAAPEKMFEAENFDDNINEFGDDEDIDDYTDFGFDENWN